jgi:hypothetical protein
MEQSYETWATERRTRSRPRSKKAVLPAKTGMMLGAGLTREFEFGYVAGAERASGAKWVVENSVL